MKAQAHWKRIGWRAHHGICVPLFSLRSKNSAGIGEFLDLIPLISWCKDNGFDTLQLLPINDTENDPSPYNPISSCALDPIYISLHEFPQFNRSEFASLNNLPRLNRAMVKEAKFEWLRHQYDLFSPSDEYHQFVQNNRWLNNYALFKAISQREKTTDWRQWKEKNTTGLEEEIQFYCYLQYLSFSQWAKIKAHAKKEGVFLKGDIPILLSPCSADVWQSPHLFDLTQTAGAPPDYYTPSGQNWGFPLFDWEKMKQEHYQWWRQRLAIAGRLYDLYRIDHVVGFFRIWAIPLGSSPLEGMFIPSDRSVWKHHGEEILNMMLDATSMLPIAEDLGTIPEEVYPCLKELGICGTKVMRWEKKHNGSYIPIQEYEPLSMTTVSTWDCDTIKGWWKMFPNEAQEFAHFKQWQYANELTFHQLFLILQESHQTPSYFHINLLQEYLSLFPDLVWPTIEEERINIPGTLTSTNWTYRFRPYLEEMIIHKELHNILKLILNR
jgi:4-alpha-glucanotransferase